jgi:hypothetical protein
MAHQYSRSKKVKIVRTDSFDDVFKLGKHLFRPSIHQIREEVIDAERKGISTIYIHSKVIPNG